MLTLRDCQPLAKRDGMTATLTFHARIYAK